MKTNILILLLLITVAIFWTAYSASLTPQFSNNAGKSEDQAQLVNLEPAADFTYSTINGEKGRLTDHAGETVLLHFWASWCAPCIVEFPDLVELARIQQEQLTVLAVSTDVSKTEIDRFLKKLKIKIPDNFIIIHDGDKKITQDLYQTIKLPETYVITPEQKIAKKLIGPQENWIDYNPTQP